MTLLDYALRLVGEVKERPGADHDPFILWCHEATTLRATTDEVAWCSSFVNRCAWHLRLPRSRSAAARSWLDVGVSVELLDARPGWDIVVFKRGPAPAGHVAIFAGLDAEDERVIDATRVRVVGGNQGNAVSVASFPRADVLGVRRLK